MNPLRRLALFSFLGSLLLFGVEPLVGRLLLPNCGGGFHVWATCLMFFQGVLFLSYLYCHTIAPRIGRAHYVVLLLPLLVLHPLSVEVHPDPSAPIGDILLSLVRSVGLPFFALATTSVIAQFWLAGSDLPERESPYRLYAASNAGSLLALLAYPLLIEPFLGLLTQRWVWSAGYVGYVGLAWWARPRQRIEAAPAEAPPAETSPAAPPSWRAYPYWFLLSMAPSMFLLAVTNTLVMDVGSLPLIWVIPLTIYLASFIVTFGQRESYPFVIRRFWLEFGIVGIFFFLRTRGGVDALTGVVHLMILGVICLKGHAELYRARPAARYLTRFYLIQSLGGWAGGVFVSVLAPIVFDGVWEYPLAIALLVVTLAFGQRREIRGWAKQEPLPVLAASILLVAFVTVQTVRDRLQIERPRLTIRNHYGVYRVSERKYPDPDMSPEEQRRLRLRHLFHGTTLHGKQFVHPSLRERPIGYYHPNSPLGDVMTRLPRPLRAAVVGLGAGGTCSYMRDGDAITFYELDPTSEVLAREQFTYLDDAEARGVEVEVVLGDARLRLSEREDVRYDLLLVDAFSSDAIPTHLLTQEALTLYLERLAPGGTLMFHISNRYYDLQPVLASTAAELPLRGFVKWRDITAQEHVETQEDPSEYMVFRREDQSFDDLARAKGWYPCDRLELEALHPWTDDYCNVLAPLWIQFKARHLAEAKD